MTEKRLIKIHKRRNVHNSNTHRFTLKNITRFKVIKRYYYYYLFSSPCRLIYARQNIYVRTTRKIVDTINFNEIDKKKFDGGRNAYFYFLL